MTFRKRNGGLDFVRAVAALARCNGSAIDAARTLQRDLGATHPSTQFLRESTDLGDGVHVRAAAPAAYTGDSGGWAEDIAEATGRQFFDRVDESSVIGALNPTPAPLNVKLHGFSSGATAAFVGEARPTPVSAGVATGISLEPATLAAVVIVSKEIVEKATPQAVAWLSAELRRACRQALETRLLSASAASAGVAPAGLLNGVTATSSSGTTTEDLRSVAEAFAGDLATSAFVARPGVFAGLAGLAHPDVGAGGGSLSGVAAVSSRYAPASTLALIDGAGIAFGDDGFSVQIVSEGDVEMLDGSLSQDGTDGTGAQMVGLWQSGCVAIKVDRFVSWAVVRPGSVAVLDSVSYGLGA